LHEISSFHRGFMTRSHLPIHCILDISQHILRHQFHRPFDAHCCHVGTAMKHPVPDRVKPSLTSGHSDAQPWASECPDVKNYKWRLNPV